MRCLILVVVGCGGGSGSGEFTATIHDGNAEVAFSESCTLKDRGDGVFDISAIGDDYGFEAIWLGSAITEPGAYNESEIGSGGSFSLEASGQLLLAHGSITFDAYDPPASVTGNLSWIAQQGATTISATADFSCE